MWMLVIVADVEEGDAIRCREYSTARGRCGRKRKRSGKSDSAIGMVYTVTDCDRRIVQEEMGGSETRLEMVDPDFDDIISRARDVERQERSCGHQTTRR